MWSSLQGVCSLKKVRRLKSLNSSGESVLSKESRSSEGIVKKVFRLEKVYVPSEENLSVSRMYAVLRKYGVLRK